ncbi:hypothetical protein BC936DRAFT_140395 [Jimgerdemannia flammicorona]|uniref:Uncharacterized protein n=1 Tax=Jimgerdemannia flammicorona TaxID=994334 RepID=A0A433AUP2_9FUNG|nr:hypothetical protein BC936DRAFT_140395 [Jimgerdemannia flammicorona]
MTLLCWFGCIPPTTSPASTTRIGSQQRRTGDTGCRPCAATAPCHFSAHRSRGALRLDGESWRESESSCGSFRGLGRGRCT